MNRARLLTTVVLLAVGLLLAVLGVLGVLGAGGDNGQRADTTEIGGHPFSTYLVGGVALALGATVTAAGVIVTRRHRLHG
jgi:Flp pilus assembly protein CpaB